MEERGLPVSRIRCPRISDPRALTAQSHRASFLLAHDEPPYPEDARAQGVEGRVILDLTLDRDGAIEAVAIREGHPLLADSALNCVRGWKWRPVKLNGKPVGIVTDVVIDFVLPDRVQSE